MSHDQPLIALCPGEPAGIGPDITATIAALDFDAAIVVIADPGLIESRAHQLGINIGIELLDSARAATRHRRGTLQVLPIPTDQPVVAGHLNAANAPYVLKSLDQAMVLAHDGVVNAIVTGPAHKGVINDAGIAFTGHTEYLTRGLPDQTLPVMLLASGSLRVALVTTHLSLRDVPNLITVDRVRQTIATVVGALQRRFGVDKPTIAVCGLNPHAGEGGHFGTEDRDVIDVAVTELSAQLDATIDGPLPADTAFTAPLRERYDAYVTMYHDQGLPVIKSLGFGEIVNITLGLPFVRTSVDHGTALDLAGSGSARADSLIAAIRAAIDLARCE